jgi:hypothetical protein
MTSTDSLALSASRAWKRFAIALCLSLTLLASTPARSIAREDPDAVHYDARVQGFNPDVELKSGGTGMMWVVMILLGVICVAVIFMDAKRSHLD